MLQHPGQLIGDAWFYVENSTVHCYYLTCPSDIPRHTVWDIGHAVSTNLVDWEIAETALERGAPGAFDNICLATGSVLRRDGRYWMAYTASKVATIGLAVSDDLYTWTKVVDAPITDLDPRYYEPIGSGSRQVKHWRDPFIFEYDGAVYHFVCASRNDGPADRRGTVGLARTTDMLHWEVLPPPAVQPAVQELECPQLYTQDGRYYLLFSSGTDWFTPEVLAAFPDITAIGDWTSYAMVADSPFGPFEMRSGRIISPDYPVQPYACQLVYWQGAWYLFGTVITPDGGVICDPIPVALASDGIHVIRS